MSATHHGRFLWFDLMTTEPDAAVEFYTKVVGWTIDAWEDAPGGPYRMFVGSDGPMGGVVKLPELALAAGAPTHWLGHVGVDSVEASLALAESLGAQLLNRETIATVGEVATCLDPWGASFSLFQPETASDAPYAPKVGEVAWHELMTGDVDQAVDFYGQLFGWQKTHAHDMGPMGIYQMYGPSESVSYGGICKFNAQMPIPAASWLFYVRVADLGAAVEAVKSNGGEVLHGPMEVPGGDHVAICRDPQGGAFALHHRSDG